MTTEERLMKFRELNSLLMYHCQSMIDVFDELKANNLRSLAGGATYTRCNHLLKDCRELLESTWPSLAKKKAENKDAIKQAKLEKMPDPSAADIMLAEIEAFKERYHSQVLAAMKAISHQSLQEWQSMHHIDMEDL